MWCVRSPQSFPGAPGMRIRQEHSATGERVASAVRGNEGPRSDVRPEDAWLSSRAPERQPSPFRRRRGQADPVRHGSGNGERRRIEEDAGVHPAATRPPCRLVSIASALRGRRDVRFGNEPCGPPGIVPQAVEGGQDREPGADVPRGPAGTKAPSLLRRELVNAFQIEFDARGERSSSLLKCRSIGCDVEIGADRMALAVKPLRITAQREGHTCSPWFSLLERAIRRQQDTTGPTLVPGPSPSTRPAIEGRPRCRTE